MNSQISPSRLIAAAVLVLGLAASLLLSPFATDPADAAITRTAKVT